MSPAEFIIVYLSSGAPFGVLVFFSKQSSSRLLSIVQSLGAAIFWPVLALFWTHRRLLQQRSPVLIPHPILEVPDLSQRSLIAEYATLTKALNDAAGPNIFPSSELFEVAGHSNPKLGAICSQRRRDSLMDRRQRASGEALIDHLLRQNSLSSNDVRSVAEYCERLGDHRTADLIIERIVIKGRPDQLPIPSDTGTADAVQQAA